MRHVNLINFKTKQAIQAKSITEFCKLAKLNGNDMFHLTPILDGKRLHHKCWCLPATMEKNCIIMDIYGNEYKLFNLLEFSQKYSLRSTMLAKLVDGKIDTYRGLYLKGTDIKFRKPIKYKYTFNKGNIEVQAINLAALSRKFHVKSPHNFYKLVHGHTSHAYGYKVKDIEPFIPDKKILI